MMKIFFGLVAASLSFKGMAAGRLYIHNHKSQPLSLKVIFDGKEDKGLPTIIPPKGRKEIKLKKKDLNGLRYYGLKGTLPPFFMGDKCKKLKPGKNYEIIFKDDPIGTTCYAFERPESFFLKYEQKVVK